MRLRDLIQLVENAGSRTLYHVTLTKNLKSIFERGLVPSVGERSKKMNEHAAVFLFDSEDAAADAVSNWLGNDESIDEDEPLALLRVTLPVEIEAKQTPNFECEWIVLERIPPECINLVDRNF